MCRLKRCLTFRPSLYDGKSLHRLLVPSLPSKTIIHLVGFILAMLYLRDFRKPIKPPMCIPSSLTAGLALKERMNVLSQSPSMMRTRLLMSNPFSSSMECSFSISLIRVAYLDEILFIYRFICLYNIINP